MGPEICFALKMDISYAFAVSTSYIESVLSLGCIDTGIFAIALPL
jgi:hypothetical protein